MQRNVRALEVSQSLPLVEVFHSVQGEGSFVGTPCLFIRTQGCDVGCPWCDTKESWPHTGGYDTSIDYLRGKAHEERHVVITGGEPMIHNLMPLIDELKSDGKTVQIETSGTELPEWAWLYRNSVFFTLSPKVAMPGDRPYISSWFKLAHEIKMPIGAQRDLEWMIDNAESFAHLANEGRVFLQPVNNSTKKLDELIYACRQYGWRISVQMHKFLELP